MKELITVVFFVALGLVLFTFIAGTGDGTLRDASSDLMRSELEYLGN